MEKIDQLREAYTFYYEKDVPPRYKNDAVWIEKKIVEMKIDREEVVCEIGICEDVCEDCEIPGGESVVLECGQVFRTYSLENHGKEYNTLAKQFCQKRNAQGGSFTIR